MKWCTLQLLLFGGQEEIICVCFKQIIIIMAKNGEAHLCQEHIKGYVAKCSKRFIRTIMCQDALKDKNTSDWCVFFCCCFFLEMDTVLVGH